MQRSSPFFSIFLSSTCALCALPAHADHVGLLSPATAEVTELEAVVVSASREGIALSQTPAAISVVSAEILTNTKPAYLHQAMNQAVGVNMVDLGNEQHTMSIRLPISYNAFYQYLEDNIPIRPTGLFNHNALLETNLNGAASIEILRGPASSLYGANAVGGAVNFLSKAPALTPEITLGMRGSARGYYRVDAGASTTKNAVGVRASYYQARNDSSEREHNDYQKQGATLRVDADVGTASQWRNVLTYNELNSQMPGSLSQTQFTQTPATSYHTFTFRGDTSARLSSTLETAWSDATHTTLTAFLRDGVLAQNPSYSISNAAGTADRNGRLNESRYQSVGIDAHWRQHFAIADGRLMLGISYDHSPTAYDEKMIRVKRSGTLDFVGYTMGGWMNVNTGQNCTVLGGSCQLVTLRRHYDATLNNASVYTQYEFSPWKNLRAVAGLRYDNIAYDYQNNIFNGTQAGFGPASEQRNFEHASPKFGAIYALTPRTDIYSNVSQGFVPPEVSALYGALTVPSLHEAIYQNIDVGIRQQFSNNAGSYELAFYQLTGKDEAVSYTSCAIGLPCPAGSMPVNAGKTRHSGVEAGTRYAFTSRMGGHINATLSQHEFETYSPQLGVNYSGKSMPMAPRTTLNAELYIKPLEFLRLSAESQTFSSYWMDEANTQKYQGYSLLNLRADYQWHGLEIYAQGLNILDKKYATTAAISFGSASYTPGDGRTFLMGMNYKFGAQP